MGIWNRRLYRTQQKFTMNNLPPLHFYDRFWMHTSLFVPTTKKRLWIDKSVHFKHLEFWDFSKIIFDKYLQAAACLLLCRSQDIRNIAFDLLISFPHIGQFNISSVVKHDRHTRWPHGKATLSPSCEQTWQFIRSTDKWVIFFNSFLKNTLNYNVVW